jgi:hypothetical protein
MSEMSLETVLEDACQQIHERTKSVGNWAQRVALAAGLGTLDPKHMVFMMQTFGCPLWLYIDRCKELDPGVTMPWRMLEHELTCIGKSKSSVASLFKEMGLTVGEA